MSPVNTVFTTLWKAPDADFTPKGKEFNSQRPSGEVKAVFFT